MSAGVVHIQETVQRVKGKGMVFQPPKTAASRRTVTLSTLAVETLREHQVAQAKHREDVERQWGDDRDLVFAAKFGTPLEPSYLSKLMRKDLAAAQLPAVGLHALRHTTATLFLRTGASPKVV